MPLRLSPKQFSSIRLAFSPALPSKLNSPNSDANPEIPATNVAALSNLREIIAKYCPSIDRDSHFKPNPLLPSGHLQTIYSAAANTVDEDVVHYKRRVLIMPDGGTLSIDISPPELAENDDGNIPTVICMHGLTGGSHEAYVRNCLSVMCAPKEAGGDGYRGVVVNFRGCANTPVTSPQLYSASKTSDLRTAVLFLSKIFPNSPFIGVGFSLGANVLAKYCGEEGSNTPIRAAIPVGTPWDLMQGSEALEDGLLMSKVYSKVMSSNLVKVITRHAATLVLDHSFIPRFDKLLNPPPSKQVQKERKGVKPQTLRYVDDNMTRYGGGYSKPYGEFPFDHAHSYYKHGGATNFLSGVRRPLLALNADDDPIVPVHIISGVLKAMGVKVEDSEKDVLKKMDSKSFTEKDLIQKGGNPNIFVALTKGGGHLGWWTSREKGWKPIRWLKNPVREFAHAMFSEEAKALDQPCSRAIAWSQKDRVVEKDVEIEFLPASSLPSYEVQVGSAKIKGASQNGGDVQNGHSQNGHAKEVKSEANDQPGGIAVTGSGASRVAWLRTKLLEEAPLVHPSDALNGWVAPSEDQVERIQVKMYCDSQRPEVGFYELESHTKVAGVGCIFQGGKQEPGSDADDKSSKKKNDSLVAGL